MPELTQVPPLPNPEIQNQNMRYFKRLAPTDPRYTKAFKRHGGFTGTAINPTYCVLRMTELFGPVGEGWGVESGELKFIDAFEKGGNELLVYAQARVWYRPFGGYSEPGVMRDKCFTPWCWGGDVVMNKTKDGYIRTDDEALKKASTDAMMKCFTFLGVAGDVHLGLYDDSKYVAHVEAEFAKEKEEAKKARLKPAATAPPPPAAPPAPAPAAEPPPPVQSATEARAQAPAAQEELPPMPGMEAPPAPAPPPAWTEAAVVAQPKGRLSALLANGAITETQHMQAGALLENMAINAHDAGYKDEKIEDWLIKVVDPLVAGTKVFAEWMKGAAAAADSMAEVAQKQKGRA